MLGFIKHYKHSSDKKSLLLLNSFIDCLFFTNQTTIKYRQEHFALKDLRLDSKLILYLTCAAICTLKLVA